MLHNMSKENHGMQVVNGLEDSGSIERLYVYNQLLLNGGGFFHPITRILQAMYFAENV